MGKAPISSTSIPSDCSGWQCFYYIERNDSGYEVLFLGPDPEDAPVELGEIPPEQETAQLGPFPTLDEAISKAQEHSDARERDRAERGLADTS